MCPVDEEGNVYLVRQYRAPIARETLELPAGKLDSKAEDRLQAAKRELAEETGLARQRMGEIGGYGRGGGVYG